MHKLRHPYFSAEKKSGGPNEREERMAGKKPRVLIIDDDVSLSKMLVNILEYEGYICQISNDGKDALRSLRDGYFDLVILDLKLPDINGMTILDEAMKKAHPPQVVMISGQGTIHAAVEATKIGAYDFLEKPLDSERVLMTLRNAMEKGRLEREKARLLADVKDKYTMVGDSPQIEEIRELVDKAARIDSKVLIEGENGTGKELVARSIYINSKRAGGPFVAVNCAAIPDTLIESELFGYKKGAFTGAVSDKKGKFQLADDGTLFFDEVADMSTMTQAKVLRVLEEGVVEMVGGSESVQTDVRVIAATNKDLQEAMKLDNFREDLYFRLNVINIKVPPLRERKEDIPALVEHFSRHYYEEHGIEKKELSKDALKRLQEYSWPGNIRELRNVVEKLIVLIDEAIVQEEDISAILANPHKSAPRRIQATSLREAKEEFEREFIRETLIKHSWNVTKSAATLDIPRTYLHSKIKKFEID